MPFFFIWLHVGVEGVTDGFLITPTLMPLSPNNKPARVLDTRVRKGVVYITMAKLESINHVDLIMN